MTKTQILLIFICLLAAAHFDPGAFDKVIELLGAVGHLV